jgi:hypothetical protein
MSAIGVQEGNQKNADSKNGNKYGDRKLTKTGIFPYETTYFGNLNVILVIFFVQRADHYNFMCLIHNPFDIYKLVDLCVEKIDEQKHRSSYGGKSE